MSTRVDDDLDQIDDEPRDIRPLDALKSVYRFFHNKRVGLFLILAMGVSSLIGLLFPQAPDDVRADAAAYAEFVESLRPKYRGWTTPLDKLGVFHMFHSIWFTTITIGLVLSIIACTCHRAPLLWRQASRPHVHVPDTFFEHGRVHRSITVPARADLVYTRTIETLRARRFHVVEDSQRPGRGVYGDRNRFAPFGTVIAHAAFVVILLGVLVTQLAGFRNDNFPVAVGTTAEVGHDTGLSVRVDDFSTAFYPDGRPKDYASDVTVLRGGAPIAQQVVRVNNPLHVDGISINQASYGIAVQVAIKDAAGKVLFEGSVPLDRITSDETMSFGVVKLPEQGLTVAVGTVASGQMSTDLAAGQLQVEVYRVDNNAPAGDAVIDQGKTATVADLRVTFVRERQFTGLMISHDPGAPIVWTGCGLLLLGTCLTMLFRHRRVWLVVEPGAEATTVKLASPDRADLGYEASLVAMLKQIAYDAEDQPPPVSRKRHHRPSVTNSAR